MNNGASDASVPNLQTFIDTFVCQANTAGIPYFFFEVCTAILLLARSLSSLPAVR